MRNHAALLLGVLLFGVALFAQAKDQEPPSLVFGGKKLYVGMSSVPGTGSWSVPFPSFLASQSQLLSRSLLPNFTKRERRRD